MPWRRRVLTYREMGAVRFNRKEREAYSIMVDLRIISRVGNPSQNLRSNPPVGFWGKWTVFHGSVPYEVRDMSFPRQRALNLRNEQKAATYNALSIMAKSDPPPSSISDVAGLLAQAIDGVQLAPILDHRPNYLKFVGLPGSQFEVTIWRLEFDEPDSFQVPPSDPDPTRGQDQYYEPAINPADNPYGGNPSPSDIPDNVDPRDFSPQDEPVQPITGSVDYEFFSASTNSFQPFSRPGLEWPGQLVELTGNGVVNEIGWRDDNGVETSLVQADSVRAEVRFVAFNSDDGRTFVPDPNTFVVNN